MANIVKTLPTMLVMLATGCFVAERMCIAFRGPASMAHAGTIRSVEPGGTFDLTGVGPNSVKPNNDDFTAGPAAPNSIGATKTFTSNTPILHKFNVDRSGGTTEYFFSERVFNQTGVDWLDFHFEIIGLNGGLDFDTDPDPQKPQKTPAPSSAGSGDPKNNFSKLNHQPGSIDWSDGLVKNGGSVFFTFSIDVPDSVSSFTLQETPSPVPEPTTLVLWGATAAGLGYLARRRRNQQLPRE
jgi:hypothetical protein